MSHIVNQFWWPTWKGPHPPICLSTSSKSVISIFSDSSSSFVGFPIPGRLGTDWLSIAIRMRGIEDRGHKSDWRFFLVLERARRSPYSAALAPRLVLVCFMFHARTSWPASRSRCPDTSQNDRGAGTYIYIYCCTTSYVANTFRNLCLQIEQRYGEFNIL